MRRSRLTTDPRGPRLIATAREEGSAVASNPARSREIDPAASITSAPQPTWAQAVDRTPAVPIHDKLTWDLADISALTGLSRRLLERELAAGRFPRADLRVGRRALWKPGTVQRALGLED